MNAHEFWHESITQASWQRLQEISGEIDCVVIGGWATWLWTRQHKSRGIDIVVSHKGLAALREKYPLEKNDRLAKYEVKMEGFDLDIYVPYYSKLELPAEDLIREEVAIEGIRTISCESLLILKQGAQIARQGSVKGKKDVIDILSILIHAPFHFGKYMAALKKYKKERLLNELRAAINEFDPRESGHYLGIPYREFAKRKSDLIGKIRALR